MLRQRLSIHSSIAKGDCGIGLDPAADVGGAAATELQAWLKSARVSLLVLHVRRQMAVHGAFSHRARGVQRAVGKAAAVRRRLAGSV